MTRTDIEQLIASNESDIAEIEARANREIGIRQGRIAVLRQWHDAIPVHDVPDESPHTAASASPDAT